MTKTTKNPETIALHGGDYRNDPATTAFVASIIYHLLSISFFLIKFVINLRINTAVSL